MLRVYILTPNELLGHIVKEVYAIELGESSTIIQVLPSEVDAFSPESPSVLVVDRRYCTLLAKLYGQSTCADYLIVPFDETDFEGIHDSIGKVASMAYALRV